jgi:hypothetical protein
MTEYGQILDFNSALTQTQAWRRSTINVDALRARIAVRAREFVEWLFPCAVIHRSGRYAVIGDVSGCPGESLQIELSGEKAGYWRDWAAPGQEGKDLIGLYIASLGYDRSRDFQRALEEIAAEFLGNSPARASTCQVTQRIRERARSHVGKARPRIDERPPPSATFTYYGYDGRVIGLVRRHDYDEQDPKTGKPRKTFSVWDPQAGKAQAPAPRPLYRIPEIARASHVVFVEGEMKADALASCSIEATCVMFGANAPLAKVDWSPIAGRLVTVWPDADEAGEAFASRVIPVLQALNCRVARVTPPPGVPAKWDAADCVAEGRDPHELINTAIPVRSGESPAKPKITILDIDELGSMPPPAWLVDGVITVGGLSVLWGRSGDLKSFVALDIAMCTSTGTEWHGRAAQHGLVVFVAAEGASGLGSRAHGWRSTKGKQLSKPKFKLVPHSVALTSEELDQLIAAILELEERPVLIIIDTLARTFGIGDENKQCDMNAYVSAADRLRTSTGAHVMIVHHSGVHEDKRERGSNVLRGAADTVIKIKRKDDKLQIINQPPEGKQKDAEEFATITLRTQKVRYGTDAAAESSTLILMLDDDPVAPSGTDDAKPGGAAETAILDALAVDGDWRSMTWLAARIGKDRKTVARAANNLVLKELLLKQDGPPQSWKIIDAK